MPPLIVFLVVSLPANIIKSQEPSRNSGDNSSPSIWALAIALSKSFFGFSFFQTRDQNLAQRLPRARGIHFDRFWSHGEPWRPILWIFVTLSCLCISNVSLLHWHKIVVLWHTHICLRRINISLRRKNILVTHKHTQKHARLLRISKIHEMGRHGSPRLQNRAK